MAGAIRISDYVVSDYLCGLELPPWDACGRAATIIEARFSDLSSSYKFIDGGIAVHATAVIEQGHALGRPSRIHVTVSGEAVRISGSGLIVADGSLDLWGNPPAGTRV